MKGTLHKTEQGWVVEYLKERFMTWGKGNPVGLTFEKIELPLHPEDSLYCLNDDVGQEIEFEIITVSKYADIDKHYAKLIPSKEQQKQLITEIMDLDAKDGLYDTVNDVEKLAKERTDAFVSNYNTYKEIRQFAHAKGFIDGFNKAKQTLYTEEQVREAMSMARKLSGIAYTNDEIIQSLKQPKKDYG
jgi:uncharacterized protein YktA (UPF0223 family)